MNMLAFLLFFASPAHAAPSAKFPFDSASCKFQGKTFEVKLDSAFSPEDRAADNIGAQKVTIASVKAEERTGKNASDDSFTFLAPQDGSLCDKTQAYAVGDTLVAVLYLADNRPFQDILHAAFYDPAKKKVVKTSTLGPLKEHMSVPGGFAFSTLVARSDADQITHVSPWGKELSGSDEDLGAFRRVSLEKGKVRTGFDPDLSYEKSPWKLFYKKKDDYLKDAGWDAKKRKFKNEVVYAATYFNYKEGPDEQKCIGMTTQRQAGVASWRCEKIHH